MEELTEKEKALLERVFSCMYSEGMWVFDDEDKAEKELEDLFNKLVGDKI